MMGARGGTQRGRGKVGSADAEVPAPLADVFISYARTDLGLAKNLAEALRREGFEVWFDAKIYAGAKWESLLTKTLAAAKAVLVVWSERSVGRPWVLKEAELATRSGRIVPLKIDDCKVPKRFSKQQMAVMTGWDGKAPHPELERLLSGLARLAPPSRLDNVRPGFDTGFLGIEVPMPAITGVAEEFRYLHFSVVMNPARRLAWYVAYNMQPGVPAKRGDRWLPDPMLPSSFQPTNDHFRGTGFDRGHLVSPANVSWGTPRQAELSNHQAFFWTNTTPQSHLMNAGWWLVVEGWERELVRAVGKVTGFAGPVLSEDDPTSDAHEQQVGRLRLRQNFRRPSTFWKVVVMRDKRGKLRVAPFLFDESALLRSGKLPPRANPPARFLSTVAEIESKTGLDWGPEIRQAPTVPLG